MPDLVWFLVIYSTLKWVVQGAFVVEPVDQTILEEFVGLSWKWIGVFLRNKVQSEVAYLHSIPD